jgi:membrane protease subunit (stomatin/prohibitin family)
MFEFFKKETAKLFIARPPEAAQVLVWRYPDQSIPDGAKLTVREDECVVFFRQGQCIGVLGAGTYPVCSSNIPFLGHWVVSPLTGDNHYLTELFFIRRAEHIHQAGPRELGQYSDVGSRHLVTLHFVARCMLQVTDPVRLLTSVAGIDASASQRVAALVDERIRSLLARYVGQLASAEPITAIVSNQFGEVIGQKVIEEAREDCVRSGFQITRFLALDVRLDGTSEALLRDFGQKMSEVEVARQPGYAQAQMLQGQRAMMQGIAAGAAQGHINMMMPMMGPSFAVPALAPLPSPRALLADVSTELAPQVSRTGPPRWYLRSNAGIEGPYSARQLVLRAGANNFDASTALVRREGASDWEEAITVEALRTEFTRRDDAVGKSRGARPVERNLDVFEASFATAVADGVVTTDEKQMLVGLAVRLGLVQDEQEGQRYVVQRAKAVGCALGEGAAASSAKGGPPLFLQRVFVYTNGVEQVAGLSADAVAARVRAIPDGVHMVWREGLPDWRPATEDEDVRPLLGVR